MDNPFEKAVIFVVGLLLGLLILTHVALGHGSYQWIADGGYRGYDNVPCCGEHDCFVIPVDDIRYTADGYKVMWRGQEYTFRSKDKGVHQSEDEHFYVCVKWAYDGPSGEMTPSGEPRCFFHVVGGA